jgi:hypothetical protein
LPCSGEKAAASTLALYGCAISFVEEARCLRETHFRSLRQTQDGAQPRREPGAITVEIGFEKADIAEQIFDTLQFEKNIGRAWTRTRFT